MDLVASVPFNRCRPNAVSTYYRASPRAAPGTTPLDPVPPHDYVELRRLIQCNIPGADPANVCLLQASWSERFVTFPWSRLPADSFGGRYGSRTRDTQFPELVLYPAELTDVDIARSEPMSGTPMTKPCRVAGTPLDERHQRTFHSKRRRWESNPLEAALQAAA